MKTSVGHANRMLPIGCWPSFHVYDNSTRVAMDRLLGIIQSWNRPSEFPSILRETA